MDEKVTFMQQFLNNFNYGLIIIYFIYFLIDFFSREIDLIQYNRITIGENCKKFTTTWYNTSKTTTEPGSTKKYDNIYFRFQVVFDCESDSEIKHIRVIFIEKNSLSFIDKIKLVKWFSFEYIRNKVKIDGDILSKELPEFLVIKYISPKLTELIENERKLIQTKIKQ